MFDRLNWFTRWRFWLLVSWLLGLAWLLPGLVLAQAVETPAPAIQRLNVQVMPEFDDPRVLVVVQGRLPDSLSLPQSLTFRIPRGAQVNQMAVINMADGRPAPRPYSVSDDPTDGRWMLATYTVDNAHFFFEYYFNPFGAGQEKAFTFTVSLLQPVDDLLLEVQQPRRAEAFAIEPVADSERIDSHGLTFYQLLLGGLQVGEETAVSIQYRKTDPTASVPRTATAAPAEDQTALLFWALGVFAVTIAGALTGFSWFRARRPKPEPRPAPTSRYCPQCGIRQRVGSRYCHACGVAL